MLERLVAGGPWLDLVDDVYVFGSYSRGATEPTDVDVAVEYTPDTEAGDYFVRALARGADVHTPLRGALRGNRRGLQFVFSQAERLAREPGFDLMHIYRRGESLEHALERVHAIEIDKAAGRSKRDAMLPEFEGLDDYLILPIRRSLIELVASGAVRMQRLELPANEPLHPKVLRVLDMRWRAQNSPPRRAACAGLAQLQREGIDLMTVALADRVLGTQSPVHVVSWTLQRLNHLPGWIRAGEGTWLHIVNPSRSRPVHALRFDSPLANGLSPNRWRLLD